jgi:hypothetical protein
MEKRSAVGGRLHRNSAVLVITLALLAAVVKLVIASNTVGSNDVLAFYTFAHSLTAHGLKWTYENGAGALASPMFNHPPLTACYLRFIDYLAHQQIIRAYGLTFPLLLRLPGIIADFMVVLILVRASYNDVWRLPVWALSLFALSPVSIMISGFHGNTDPVMVMFLLFAGYACLRNAPVWCGLFFALSCQIKVIPLLLLPILFFFWLARRATSRFVLPFVSLCLLMWSQPLLTFPALFLKNVFAYGGFWGTWGITYWLRLTGFKDFNGTGAFNLPITAVATSLLLKIGIVAIVLAIAWRRRRLGGPGVIHSIAYSWIVFFVFAPAIAVQYMVWLAPFVLLLSPTFYGWLTASTSAFLFFFYNTVAHGLPWYIAVSSNDSKMVNAWIVWSLWPWATLVAGMIVFWKYARAAKPALRLFSLATLPAVTRES